MFKVLGALGSAATATIVTSAGTIVKGALGLDAMANAGLAKAMELEKSAIKDAGFTQQQFDSQVNKRIKDSQKLLDNF